MRILKFNALDNNFALLVDDGGFVKSFGNIDSDKSYDVDFDLLATNREAAQDAFDSMKSLVDSSERMTMAEKIYLNMAAQKLGVSLDD